MPGGPGKPGSEQAGPRERQLAQVQATLSELEHQIQGARELEPARRERLLAELAPLRALLETAAERGGRPASGAAPERDRLEQLALEFEVSHPSAAELLGRLANLLASMGI